MSILLWVPRVPGVRARDEDAAVREELGFGVVEAGDVGGSEGAHALADGFGGVVEDGGHVGVGGAGEAGDALVGAVEDEECAIGESDLKFFF